MSPPTARRSPLVRATSEAETLNKENRQDDSTEPVSHRLSENPTTEDEFMCSECGNNRSYCICPDERLVRPEGPNRDPEAAGSDLRADLEELGYRVRDGRPFVVVKNVNLHDLTEGVLLLLNAANDPSTLFDGPEGPTRIRLSPSGESIMEALDRSAIALAIANEVDTVAITARGAQVKVPPPATLVRGIASHASTGFPALLGIARSPMMRPDGRVIGDGGYDGDARLYFELDADLDLPTVADHPSAADLRAALELLQMELLSDFLWDDPSSAANAIGLILTAPAAACPCTP